MMLHIIRVSPVSVSLGVAPTSQLAGLSTGSIIPATNNNNNNNNNSTGERGSAVQTSQYYIIRSPSSHLSLPSFSSLCWCGEGKYKQQQHHHGAGEEGEAHDGDHPPHQVHHCGEWSAKPKWWILWQWYYLPSIVIVICMVISVESLKYSSFRHIYQTLIHLVNTCSALIERENLNKFL